MSAGMFDEAKALERAGETERAAELYRRAAESDPADFRSHHNLGAMLEALGSTDEAAAAYERALEANPDATLSHYSLARLRHLSGQLDRAEPGYRRALALDPNMTEAHFNLGRLLLEQGEAEGAEAELRTCTRLNPDQAGTSSYLGDALFAQRRLPEALEEYRRTVELAPGEASAQFDVAKSLEMLNRLEEAIDHYRKSIVLEPSSAAAREALARTLYSSGRREDAIGAVREWMSLAPDHPIAIHLLASLGGADAPTRASDAYVADTFDRFAPDFDTMLERLEYRAPQLLTAAVALALGEPRGALDVLDAGCGTGLCAPLLRPFAKRLEGVDLSAGMLKRASRRGYDALYQAELTKFIAQYQASWHLIVSADTLCYFGDLSPVLRVAVRALRPGGVLAFTLERLEEHLVSLPSTAGAALGSRTGAGPTVYALGPHGRYAHLEGYVLKALSMAGFVATMAHATLRNEGGTPVEGLVVTARRPNDPPVESNLGDSA